MSINELRLVLTVEDFDRATALFRDALGLKQLAAWQNGGGHIVLLDAGHATLEIVDERQAQAIDEIEVGRRVANALAAAGAEIIAGPPSRRS
jgi:catechol 2,3-dioxygenase-like lactoylglutathione lyase family enzyme